MPAQQERTPRGLEAEHPPASKGLERLIAFTKFARESASAQEEGAKADSINEVIKFLEKLKTEVASADGSIEDFLNEIHENNKKPETEKRAVKEVAMALGLIKRSREDVVFFQRFMEQYQEEGDESSLEDSEERGKLEGLLKQGKELISALAAIKSIYDERQGRYNGVVIDSMDISRAIGPLTELPEIVNPEDLAKAKKDILEKLEFLSRNINTALENIRGYQGGEEVLKEDSDSVRSLAGSMNALAENLQIIESSVASLKDTENTVSILRNSKDNLNGIVSRLDGFANKVDGIGSY